MRSGNGGRESTISDWERWKELRDSGVSVIAIANRYQVSRQTVYNGLASIKETETESAPPLPRLTLDFGSSTLPMTRLTCRDIHPCRECEGIGRILRVSPVEVVDTSGLVTIESVPLPVACFACEGSGLAPYRPGSHLCCADCHQSGIDSHPLLSRTGTVQPAPEGKPTPTRYRRGRLKGGIR